MSNPKDNALIDTYAVRLERLQVLIDHLENIVLDPTGEESPRHVVSAVVFLVSELEETLARIDRINAGAER